MPGTTLLALRILMSIDVARAICLGDFFAAPEPEKARRLWDAGIYDASVTFFTAGQKLDEAAAQKLARSAAGDETRSFSFGDCPTEKPRLKKTEKSWLALFTAPTAAKITANELNVGGSSSCTEISVRWVGSSGVSHPLEKKSAKSKDDFWQLPAKDGVVTVTCGHDLPLAKPSDLGPELWFSIPTGKGPSIRAPHQELLANTQDTKKSFMTWINSVRADEKKMPLKRIDEASSMPGVPDLTSDSTPIHDRKSLRTMKELGNKKLGLVMTGENRVVAATLADSAWLFWNSPRHRDLLLDPKASHALIQSKSNKGQGIVLSVVLFSR